MNADPVTFLQFAFGVSCSAGIAVSILGGWHCYLIATAQVGLVQSTNTPVLRANRSLVVYVVVDVGRAADQPVASESPTA